MIVEDTDKDIQLKLERKSYLAGYFDAKSKIQVYTNPPYSSMVTLDLYGHRKFVVAIKNRFGGTIHHNSDDLLNNNYQKVFRITLSCRILDKFIEYIDEYVVFKRELVDLIKEYRATFRRKRKKLSANERKIEYSLLLAKRQMLAKKIRKLK